MVDKHWQVISHPMIYSLNVYNIGRLLGQKSGNWRYVCDSHTKETVARELSHSGSRAHNCNWRNRDAIWNPGTLKDRVPLTERESERNGKRAGWRQRLRDIFVHLFIPRIVLVSWAGPGSNQKSKGSPERVPLAASWRGCRVPGAQTGTHMRCLHRSFTHYALTLRLNFLPQGW